MKIFLIIVGVILGIIIIGVVIMRMLMNVNFKVLKPDEKIIANGDENKKALILYQRTRHNSATDITMALADKLHELGYRVTVNYPSAYINYDLSDYDMLAFGSGAYAGSVANVLKAYMQNVDFTGQKVLLYSIGVDRQNAPELENLRTLAGAADVIESIKLAPGETEKIAEFAQNYVTQIENRE